MSVSMKIRQVLMPNYLGGKKVLHLQFTHIGERTVNDSFCQQHAVFRHIFICNQTQFKNCISSLFTVFQHVIIENFPLIGNLHFFPSQTIPLCSSASAVLHPK